MGKWTTTYTSFVFIIWKCSWFVLLAWKKCVNWQPVRSWPDLIICENHHHAPGVCRATFVSQHINLTGFGVVEINIDAGVAANLHRINDRHTRLTAIPPHLAQEMVLTFCAANQLNSQPEAGEPPVFPDQSLDSQ